MVHESLLILIHKVAIYDIGCALGSIATFVFGESIGRTRTLMTGASIMLIGTVSRL